MNPPFFTDVLRLLVTLAVLALPSAAAADSAVRAPSAVVAALADRIYAIGETTGSAADMIAAEKSAADEIRRHIASGASDGLLTNAKGQLSPLHDAAYMGYPNVVEALLTAAPVRQQLDKTDERGMTPRIAATLSLRQAALACNPALFENPWSFIPMLVTQPYYVDNPDNPYARTAAILDKAGARLDTAQAKAAWTVICKNQLESTRAQIAASTDLQRTTQQLGTTELNKKLIELQEKAAAGRER